jgi:hypothetical protein
VSFYCREAATKKLTNFILRGPRHRPANSMKGGVAEFTARVAQKFVLNHDDLL